MAALIIVYVFATSMAAFPLLARNRILSQAREANDERAADLRRYAESSWTALVFGAWGFLCMTGGAFLLARGFMIGWAWIGASLILGLGIVVNRWHRDRILAALGDRGGVDRGERYASRAASSTRWGALALAGWVGSKIVQYPYPDRMPEAAEGIRTAFMIVTVVGALAFAAIRARMFLQGDDLAPARGSERS